MTAFGRLYGVGIGPGDPDLLTVKATKIIAASPVVAFFAKAGRRGNARAIVDCWLKPSHVELPLYYPMTVKSHFDDPPYREALARFYKECTVAIASHLEAGRDVALLSEGDPMLYGSFMHLFIRLRDNFDVSIVPGVSSICGGLGRCWRAHDLGGRCARRIARDAAAGRTQAPACARRRRGDHEDRPQFRARQGGADRDGHGGARHLCRARYDGGRGGDAVVSKGGRRRALFLPHTRAGEGRRP